MAYSEDDLNAYLKPFIDKGYSSDDIEVLRKKWIQDYNKAQSDNKIKVEAENQPVEKIEDLTPKNNDRLTVNIQSNPFVKPEDQELFKKYLLDVEFGGKENVHFPKVIEQLNSMKAGEWNEDWASYWHSYGGGFVQKEGYGKGLALDRGKNSSSIFDSEINPQGITKERHNVKKMQAINKKKTVTKAELAEAFGIPYREIEYYSFVYDENKGWQAKTKDARDIDHFTKTNQEAFNIFGEEMNAVFKGLMKDSNYVATGDNKNTQEAIIKRIKDIYPDGIKDLSQEELEKLWEDIGAVKSKELMDAYIAPENFISKASVDGVEDDLSDPESWSGYQALVLNDYKKSITIDHTDFNLGENTIRGGKNEETIMDIYNTPSSSLYQKLRKAGYTIEEADVGSDAFLVTNTNLSKNDAGYQTTIYLATKHNQAMGTVGLARNINFDGTTTVYEMGTTWQDVYDDFNSFVLSGAKNDEVVKMKDDLRTEIIKTFDADADIQKLINESDFEKMLVLHLEAKGEDINVYKDASYIDADGIKHDSQINWEDVLENEGESWYADGLLTDIKQHIKHKYGQGTTFYGLIDVDSYATGWNFDGTKYDELGEEAVNMVVEDVIKDRITRVTKLEAFTRDQNNLIYLNSDSAPLYKDGKLVHAALEEEILFEIKQNEYIKHRTISNDEISKTEGEIATFHLKWDEIQQLIETATNVGDTDEVKKLEDQLVPITAEIKKLRDVLDGLKNENTEMQNWRTITGGFRNADDPFNPLTDIKIQDQTEYANFKTKVENDVNDELKLSNDNDKTVYTVANEKLSRSYADLNLQNAMSHNFTTKYVINDYKAWELLDRLGYKPLGNQSESHLAYDAHISGRVYELPYSVIIENSKVLLEQDGDYSMPGTFSQYDVGKQESDHYESSVGHFGLFEYADVQEFGWWEEHFFDEDVYSDDDKSRAFKDMILRDRKKREDLVNTIGILEDMIYLHEDPTSTFDTYGERLADFWGDKAPELFLGAMGLEHVQGHSWVGEESKRVKMDRVEALVGDLLTENQVANITRSGMYEFGEGTISFIPAIIEFALVEAALVALEAGSLGTASPVAVPAMGIQAGRFMRAIAGVSARMRRTRVYREVVKGKSIVVSEKRLAQLEKLTGFRRYTREFDAAVLKGVKRGGKKAFKYKKLWTGRTIRTGKSGRGFKGGVTASGGAPGTWLGHSLKFFGHGLREELKMKLVFGEHYKPGGGFAFYGVGRLLRSPFSKLKFGVKPGTKLTGWQNSANSIINLGHSGTAGMISVQVAHHFEGMVDDMRGRDVFNPIKDVYSKITMKDALVDFFVFATIGVKGVISYKKGAGNVFKNMLGFRSYKALEGLEKDSNEIMWEQELKMEQQMEDYGVNEAKEKHGENSKEYKKKVEEWENSKEFKEASNEFQKYSELNAAVKFKLGELRKSALWQNPKTAEKMAKKEVDSFKAALKKFNPEKYKSVKVKFINTHAEISKTGKVKKLKEGKGAEYNTNNNTITVDVHNVEPGKLPHEFDHWMMDVLFEERPYLAVGLKKVIKESLGRDSKGRFKKGSDKIFKGVMVLDKDGRPQLKNGKIWKKDMSLDEMIEMNYGKQTEKMAAMEYTGFVAQLLQQPKYYDQFMEGIGTKEGNVFQRLSTNIRKWYKGETDLELTQDFNNSPVGKRNIITFLSEFAISVGSSKVTTEQFETYDRLSKNKMFDTPTNWDGRYSFEESVGGHMGSKELKAAEKEKEDLQEEKVERRKLFVSEVDGMTKEKRAPIKEDLDRDIRRIDDKLEELEKVINVEGDLGVFEREVQGAWETTKDKKEAAWNIAEMYDSRINPNSAGSKSIENELTRERINKKTGKKTRPYSKLPNYKFHKSDILNDILYDSNRSIRAEVEKYDPNTIDPVTGRKVPVTGMVGSILWGKKGKGGKPGKPGRGVSESVNKFIPKDAVFSVDVTEAKYMPGGVHTYELPEVKKEKIEDLPKSDMFDWVKQKDTGKFVKALKFPPGAVEGVRAELKGLNLDQTSAKTLKDLVPEITKKHIIEKSGKGPKGRAEFIAEDIRTIFDLQMKGVVTESGELGKRIGAKGKDGKTIGIEGLSTDINDAVLAVWFKPSSRIVSKGAKASYAHTGRGEGLKAMEKMKWTSEKDMLERIGIEIIDGKAEIISAREMQEAKEKHGEKSEEFKEAKLRYRNVTETLHPNILAEFGRVASISIIDNLINSGKAPKELVEKHNLVQFSKMLKAPFDPIMASKDFNSELFDLGIEDLLKHKGAVTHAVASDYTKQEKYNGYSKKEKLHFVKAIKKLTDLNVEVSEIEGLKLSREQVKGALAIREATSAREIVDKVNEVLEKVTGKKGLIKSVTEKERDGELDNVGIIRKFQGKFLSKFPERFFKFWGITTGKDIGHGNRKVLSEKYLAKTKSEKADKTGLEFISNNVNGLIKFFNPKSDGLEGNPYPKAKLADAGIQTDNRGTKKTEKNNIKDKGLTGFLKDNPKTTKKEVHENLVDALKHKDAKDLRETYDDNMKLRKDYYTNIYKVIHEASKDYLKSKGTKGEKDALKELTEIVQGAVWHLQAQTNNSMGIPKGTATVIFSMFKLGKPFRMKLKGDKYKDVYFHSEHNMQLLNNTLEFLHMAIRNGTKPKQFAKEFEVLNREFHQAFVMKELQKIYDSAIMGGPAKYSKVFAELKLGEISSIVNFMIKEGITSDVLYLLGKPGETVMDFLVDTYKSKLKDLDIINKDVPLKWKTERFEVDKQLKLKTLERVKDLGYMGSKDLTHEELKEKEEVYKKAMAIGNSITKKRKGISVWDFDDTLARTKSGVRYTIPNPSGKPAPQKKVIFMAGGAGSGKSNVIKKLDLKKQGFKIVNQDISLQWLAKNHGLPTDMREFTSEQASKWSKLGWEARNIAIKKKTKYQGKGDGIIVDGTGASIKMMEKNVKEFVDKGYDVQMIFVETSLETSQARNLARKERSLRTGIVIDTWNKVMDNKSEYRKMFKKNFAEINTDNLKQGDSMPPELVKKLDAFTKGYIKGRLNAGEFADKSKELTEKGAEFDFTEFEQIMEPRKGPLFDKAKERNEKFGNKDVFVLTARPKESQQPIFDYLKKYGLDIRKENITALADGRPEAKADWIVKKVSEGYNDFYFADDATGNVRAVKDVLEKVGARSKVVQAVNDIKDIDRLDSPDVYSNIMASKDLRLEYERTITKHRPDLVKEGLVSKSVDEMIDFVDKLNVPINKRKKYQRITTKWLATSNVKLREDGYKIKDAVELAEKYKEDIFSYNNPNQIIEKYAGKVKEKPTNPKDVKEFAKGTVTNKKHGITEHVVADTKEGQQAVRKVMDTHFGEKSNPWCLAQKKNGKLTEESWDRWEHYSDGPKSLVFQNGKLIGFKANEQYWDRMDNATDAPVVRIKEGRVTKTVELVPIGEGKVSEFVMETRTTSKDKKTVTTEYHVERSLDAEGYYFHQAGTKVVENKINGITVKETVYKPNGKIRRITEFKSGKEIESRSFQIDGKTTMSINRLRRDLRESKPGEFGDFISHEAREGKIEYWFGETLINGKVTEIGFKTPTGFEVMDIMKRVDGKLRVDLNELRKIDPDVKGLPKEVVKPEGEWMRNLKPVKKVLDQLDINSDVQQNIMGSKDLNRGINDMIERKKDIKSKKKFTAVEAALEGKGKGKFSILPASADDFAGMLYRFLGKGKQGEKDMKFFEDALLKPFGKGINNLNVARQRVREDYVALLESIPKSKANLRKEMPGFKMSKEQAVRVYLWNKSGFKIPGISKSMENDLIKSIEKDADLKLFAEQLNVLIGKNKYNKPGEHWLTENIAFDLHNMLQGSGRKELLKDWIENKDLIFSKQNMNKIEAAYGAKFRETLEDILYRMETGSNRNFGSNRFVNGFANFMNNSTAGIMFFNMRTAVLQTLSSANYVNWTFNNPLKAGMAIANIPQFCKDFARIFNSDMLKQRRSGLRMNINEAELADALVGQKNKYKAALGWLLKKGFLPTKIADSFAISLGGSTWYRNRIKDLIKKEGLSKIHAERKAWLEFQEVTERTQQSSRADLISQQQASPLGRFILAFANTPMQYARIQKKAMLDLANGRGDTKHHVSKIIYYGVVQSAIFHGLQSALFAIIGSEDEDEIDEKKERIINNMIDTQLVGLFGFGGRIASQVKNTIYEYLEQDAKESDESFATRADHTYTMLQVLNISPPFGSKMRKFYSSIQSERFNRDVIRERGFHLDNPAYEAFGNLVAAATNIPLDRLFRKINNMQAVLDSENENWERVAMALGWSKWEFDIKDPDIEQLKLDIKDRKKLKKKKEVEIEKEKKKELKLKEKYPNKSIEEIKEIVNIEEKNKEFMDLDKKQQVKILESYNIDHKKFPKEADRVKKIMELYNDNVSKMDSTIKAHEDYVPTKQEKRIEELFKTTKKDQVNLLMDLGLSSKQIRNLKYEEDRVNMIIKLQTKKTEPVYSTQD